MKSLKRLVLLAVISLTVIGCATYRPQLILLPVEKFQFITTAGDTLNRAKQNDTIQLPVDGVWISIGEKTRYETALEWAVKNGYKPQ